MSFSTPNCSIHSTTIHSTMATLSTLQSAVTLKTLHFSHLRCLCFEWFSKSSAINSLHIFQQLVFVTQTGCVYCKVGTDLLYICYTDWGFSSHRAKPQAVSRRVLTAEASFRSQASRCEVCGGQNDTGTGFRLSVLFHRFSILIFIHIWRLPERQTCEAWEPSKKRWSFGNPHRPVANSPKSWDVQSGAHPKFFTGEGEGGRP